MLGGYQILDLRKIDLTITKTQSNITDAYVLSQLLKLRDFIDKDYDFSKPIENQLKPVLIRYRDKKNGEKSEGAMFGELAVVDNYYTFKITGRISGALILTIKVAFQEITNAYGAKEWVINTAKIQLQDVIEDLEGNLALEGDLDVGGDLTVTGSINGEENPSVKPIYCHPIYCKLNREYDNLIIVFTCLIFNNSATPFTPQTFFDWAKDLFSDYPNASIMASGFAGTNPLSRIKDGDSEYYLNVELADSNSALQTLNLSVSDMSLEASVFVDGVNKIN